MLNRIKGIRKRWFVVAASVALLAVGLTFGTVLASNASLGGKFGEDRYYDQRGGNHFRNNDAWLNRVAEILGVERADLDNAFATASDERANAKFEGYVQGLADDETITSEQATAANNWFDERPANSGPLALRLAGTSDSDKVDNFLARLVENEKLTQDESDALGAWHDNRPDSLPEASRGDGRHGHDDDDEDDDNDDHRGTRWGKYGHGG